MTVLIIIIHVIVCVALIMIVLLQTGKGADMGAVFGGGASQTLFGSSGASNFLSKATTWAAIIFMVTSLGLAYISSKTPHSSIVLKNKSVPVKQKALDKSKDKNTKAEAKPLQPEQNKTTSK